MTQHTEKVEQVRRRNVEIGEIKMSNEITIDRLKEIALNIKLDVVKDLDISDERFNGICEGLDRVINNLKEVAE